MSRPKGSIIGARPTWTTTATSGIWTLRQAEEMKADGKWPRGPVAPTSLAGTPGDGQVALTWVAPATTHGTIADYVIEYTPAAGSPTVVATGSTAASYTLTGLTNDTEYTIRVAAVNHTRGDWSDSLAVTPSAAVSPTSIAGLQLWLDASDASTLYDATSGGSLVAADGSVARWEDKSGNSYHATQSNAARQPQRKTSIQNGLDVLRLDQDALSLSLSLSANNWTFFVAAKPGSNTANSRYYLDSQTGRLIFAQLGNTSSNIGWYDGTWRTIAAATTAAQVLTYRLSSSENGAIFRNGSSLGTAAYTQKAIGGGVHVLSDYDGGGGFADGDVYEMILYEGALSTGDREAVENYLMTKWGIS